MKYLSLFSGIGGFDLALNNQGHKCIGYSEINKYAIKIYEKNFGLEVKNYGDITKINTGELPEFELLCGGFPCQPFSIAGKRKGFQDTRGTMFYEICRIIKDKRPPFILLENVKGLLNHSSGETFNTIIYSLDELGYSVEWQVFNSKYYTGQNRERVYILGHLRKGGSIKGILPIYYEHRINITTSKDSPKKVLSCFTTRSPKARLNIDSSYIVDRKGIRSPTPEEYERGQGFPTSWTEGISISRRYTVLGNAVTVPVVEDIIKKFLIVCKKEVKE